LFNFRLWPFVSFRGREIIRSLSDQAGRQMVGNADWFGREWPEPVKRGPRQAISPGGS
jgi:hypothetical protein